MQSLPIIWLPFILFCTTNAGILQSLLLRLFCKCFFFVTCDATFHLTLTVCPLVTKLIFVVFSFIVTSKRDLEEWKMVLRFFCCSHEIVFFSLFLEHGFNHLRHCCYHCHSGNEIGLHCQQPLFFRWFQL